LISLTSIALSRDALSCDLQDAEARELTVEVIENEAAFMALRDEWRALLSSSSSDCLFLTWEWLHTWWKHLGHDKPLFIVTVRAGEQLIAIAPLTITRAWVGPVTVPMLEFAGSGMVGSDYLDFIVSRERETPALAALTSFLADRGMSLWFPRVKKGSAAANAVSHALVDRGWHCLQTPTDVSPFINLDGQSWESYVDNLGSRHRYNFRRRLRNLHKNYAVSIEHAATEPQRHKALQHLVNLHLLRWETKGGSTAFCNANLTDFHEEMSRLALERGWLRLLVMTLDGVPAAAIYGFHYGGTYYFYQSGFDPQFRQSSVGLVTIGLTIEEAIREGAAEYDFLHGEETYKSLWTKRVRHMVRLELFPPGRMGRVHRNTTRVMTATKKLAKRVLKKDLPPPAAATQDDFES
jgi:CelD/BcsL family acetyltransferase involved in cellulose biosynthesis